MFDFIDLQLSLKDGTAWGTFTDTCTPENDCPIDRSAGLATDAEGVAVHQIYGPKLIGEGYIGGGAGGSATPVTPPSSPGKADRTTPKVKKIRITRKGRVYTLRWKLSEPASVKIRVEALGKKFIAKTQSGRPAKTGRLKLGKLKRGRYKVSLTPTDAAWQPRQDEEAGLQANVGPAPVRSQVMGSFVSRGFGGRRRVPEEFAGRLPPGQHVEPDFPVLTAGPTPRIEPGRVDASVRRHGRRAARVELGGVPRARVRGRPVRYPLRDELVEAGHALPRRGAWTRFSSGVEPLDAYAMVYSYGGYTTNLAIEDLTDGKAWVVTEHEGEPLPREHGGPARLLVPHLYFWKSAKWVAGLRVMDHDEPGFWEANGYHNRGDPWKEERYWTD